MLPFSYNFNKSKSVTVETNRFIESNVQIKNDLYELSWTFNSIGRTIPHTVENLWSGHFMPFVESFDEYQISYVLCCQGLYKQAMASLRSVLEIGLLSVYYNINDEGHNTVKGWLESKDGRENNTPLLREIWDILKQNNNIAKFQEKYDLYQKMLGLGYLHNYVHTKGSKFSNKIGRFKSNFQTFEIPAFNEWLTTSKKIIEVISILHLLKYPIAVIEYDYERKFGIDIPSFGGLEFFEQERIKKLLGQEVFNFIHKISQEDQSVSELINYFNSLPDITKDQVDEQIKRIDDIMDKDNIQI